MAEMWWVHGHRVYEMMKYGGFAAIRHCGCEIPDRDLDCVAEQVWGNAEDLTEMVDLAEGC